MAFSLHPTTAYGRDTQAFRLRADGQQIGRVLPPMELESGEVLPWAVCLTADPPAPLAYHLTEFDSLGDVCAFLGIGEPVA